MRHPFALPAAVATLLALAAPATAATVHVDVQNDENDGSCAPGDCSLREAVKYAPAGATVDVPAGTYSLAGELVVPRSMTIDGAGPGATTVTAGGAHRTIHDTAGPVTLRDLKITGGNGNGTGLGGGILDGSTKRLTLDRVRVVANSADRSTGVVLALGGGGVAANGDVVVTRSVVEGNGTSLEASDAAVASGGGGILVTGGTLTVTASEIRDNQVLVQGAQVDDESVTFNGGGGIFVGAGATSALLYLTRSTVAGNSVGVNGQTKVSENGGGGAYLYDHAGLVAENATVSGNEAHVPAAVVDNGGGGIFADNSTGSLVNVTLAGNTATGAMMDAGGALYRDGGSILARNTILASNTADGGANCFGSLDSRGRNLEDADTCGLHGAGDRTATPIALGPLAANGGPTRTQAIFKSGPAFDTATDCPPTDQRGVTRSTGHCDRGAFEVGLPTVRTRGVARVRTTSARLRGTVNPNGRATTYSFLFGKTRAYGQRTAGAPAGAAIAARPVSAAATALEPATIYHYRLVARNALGRTLGADHSFVTHMRLPAGCVKDRSLTVHIGRPRGTRAVFASARIAGEVVGSAGGTDVRLLELDHLPDHEFRLDVNARLAGGREVDGSRRYVPCP